jgi:hypothetical protein
LLQDVDARDKRGHGGSVPLIAFLDFVLSLCS